MKELPEFYSRKGAKAQNCRQTTNSAAVISLRPDEGEKRRRF